MFFNFNCKNKRMIESKHPEKAAYYYLQASDTTMIEDRPQHACEYACKSKLIDNVFFFFFFKLKKKKNR